MKRAIFTRDTGDMSHGSSNIKIEFSEDMTPNEAAEFLVKELKQWNSISLRSLKKITIE